MSLEENDKIVCSDRLQVTVHKRKNFAFQIKHVRSSALYGTKVGYPILQLSPATQPISKGKERHRLEMIISRVFKMIKHRKQGVGMARLT